MGNIPSPQAAFSKNQRVEIRSSALSHEHVPVEIKRYGPHAIALQTLKVMQSRNAQPIYVTRIYYPQSKHYETVLTTDLHAI